MTFFVASIAWITYIPSWLINHFGMYVIDPCFNAFNKKRELLKKEHSPKLEDKKRDLSLPKVSEKTEIEGFQECEKDAGKKRIADEDSQRPKFKYHVTCPIKIKPRKWLYCDTYDLSDFVKIWDAKQLIKSMVELLAFSNRIDEETDDFEYDVKRARVASVLRAYTGISFEVSLNVLDDFYCGWFCDDLTDDKAKVIIASVKNKTNNEVNSNLINEARIAPCSISSIFHAVMMYRKEIENAMNVYSGLLESNFGFSIGIKKVESIYNPILNKANNEIDDFLVLLLGDTYSKTFKEVDLIRLYDYPTITDRQIMDWKYGKC